MMGLQRSFSHSFSSTGSGLDLALEQVGCAAFFLEHPDFVVADFFKQGGLTGLTLEQDLIA